MAQQHSNSVFEQQAITAFGKRRIDYYLIGLGKISILVT
jgi:hypothetical protein